MVGVTKSVLQEAACKYRCQVRNKFGRKSSKLKAEKCLKRSKKVVEHSKKVRQKLGKLFQSKAPRVRYSGLFIVGKSGPGEKGRGNIGKMGENPKKEKTKKN